jgi:hypothetical protein
LRQLALLLFLLLTPSAHAREDLAYGTNRITPANLYTLQQKVQWNGPGKVQILRTDHFDIYMGVEEDALASRIAAIAEDWYPRLEGRMGVHYDSLTKEGERIPLIGYTSETRFQTTNTSPGFVGEGVQGFFDLIRGRIVLPFTGSNEMLEHVVRHEMVHSFTLPLLEASWKRYQHDRDRVRERKRDWGELVYVARRFTQRAEKGVFPRFVRGALLPREDEVGLPPLSFGPGKLHPQIFLGFEKDSGRERKVRVSVRLTNGEEAASLAALPDSSKAALARALERAGGGDSRIRVLSRAHPWDVEANEEVLFDEAVPAGDAPSHLERLLVAIPAGRGAAPRLDSTRTELDLLILDSVDPARFREAWKRVAPLLAALGRLPYDGPVTPEHERPSDRRFEEAERALFRYVPPDLKPRLFSLGVMEGVAEYYAADWSDMNDLVLRDIVHEGKLVPFQDLGPQHGYLVYVEGLSFFRYLSARFGEEKIGLLLRSLYRGYRQSDVFEAVFGEKLRDLSDGWERSLQRRYFAQFPEQKEIREYAEQVDGDYFVGPPRADRGRLLFASYRDGRAEMRLMEGERARTLAKDRLPGFESLHLGDASLDIRGDRVAFTALSKGRDEVVIATLPEGDISARKRFESLLTIESLALSPDGREGVIAALDDEGKSDLFRFTIDGDTLRRLTDDIAHETDLSWDENGILFVADREKSGRYDLHRIGPNGEETRLLRLPQSIWNPRGHGEDILFLTREGERAKNVELFDPAAGSVRPITRDAVGISAFDVDGDTLYLRTNRELRFAIYKASLSALLDSAAGPETVALAPPSRPWTVPDPVPFERKPYKRSFEPDLFFVTGNAFYSQSLLGFSDILGDRKIAFFLGSNANRTDDLLRYLSGGMTVYFLEHRVDWRVGAFRYADEYLTDEQGFYFRREEGVLGGFTYPFDRFRSVGMNVLLKHVHEEPLGVSDGRDFGEATLQGILGYDTAVPERLGYGFGSGVLASLLFSTDIEVTPRREARSSTVLGDLRVYFPLGRDFVWANRVSGGASFGDFPQQILIGGSLTLRGYDFLSLRGNRYFLANEEIRFPLPIRLLVGELPLIARLQGAGFVDVGDAWFDRRSPVFRGSTGFGLRTGFGGAVLRWDLAKKFEDRRLQGGWTTDFFVGWNY